MSEQTKLYIGTSGWSYPRGEGTWKGHFYPRGTRYELEYYSQFFNTVEVNSSFYRPPEPGYAARWAQQTPTDFLFTVKLWQKFTHPKMYLEATGQDAAISQADVNLFRRGLEPLVAAGKLGALLAQFPPSFHADAYGKDILAAVLRTFKDYPLAVELRHRSWSDDPAAAATLRDHDASWVMIDEPKFRDSLARELPLTARHAYFRYHGRNAANWWHGDNETRYKHLYSPEEIRELSAVVRGVAGQVDRAFLMFNNHWQGYAPKNATDLKNALG
jgi:uncharacterized protein YecE (DUF72 family)